MEKGREFWLTFQGNDLVGASTMKPVRPFKTWFDMGGSDVHVIEKSYADKLEAELAEKKEALRIVDLAHGYLVRENRSLEEKLSEMSRKCELLQIENAKLSHLLSREDEST